MSETWARIAPNGAIEFADAQNNSILGLTLTPQEAVFLARGLFAAAATLSGPNPPAVGQTIGDAHLPIMQWLTGTSKFTGQPALILTVPGGGTLTFVMPPRGAIEMGAALVSQGQGNAPPEGHRGTVH